MKKIFKIILGPFLIMVVTFSSCKKEDDSADQFVGKYNYTLTATTYFETGELTIKKISENKVSIMRKDSVVRPFTINGKKMIEDAGQEAEHIPLSGGGWATFIESSSGEINGNEILFNGTYSSPHWESISFHIRATKK